MSSIEGVCMVWTIIKETMDVQFVVGGGHPRRMVVHKSTVK